MNNFDYKASKKALKGILKESRYIHTLGVVEEGLKLNKHFNLWFDEERVKAMCLLHDACKNHEQEYYEKYKDQFNIPEDFLRDKYKLHAYLATIVGKLEYGCDDEEILEAIRIHTTGKMNMSNLEKLLYLADAIEENRDYPGVKNIRKQGYKNLNLGVLASMNNTISFLEHKGAKFYDDTYQIRDNIRRDIMQEKLEIVLKACDDKLGEDIKTIEIGDKSSLGDYFVLVTGGSILQTKAIANEIEEKIEDAGYEVYGKEGLRDGGWILLDLGDIIVHIFTKNQREFYNLEKLWD